MNPNQNPRESSLFKTWHAKTSTLMEILATDVQSADYVPGRTEPLFVKVKAELQDRAGQTFTRIIFLRGSSVGMLVILVCEGQEYAVLVEQEHPAIGEKMSGIPAGMIAGETIHSAGLREIEEETGIKVLPHELIDLASLFYKGTWNGVYPSPGACDEIIHLYFCRKEVEKKVLDEIHGRNTGLAEESEFITVRIVKLEDLCVSTPDPKTHSAFIMYQTLKAKGALL